MLLLHANLWLYSADMAKHYQTASVLYDVLKTVVPPERIDEEVCLKYSEYTCSFDNFVYFLSNMNIENSKPVTESMLADK